MALMIVACHCGSADSLARNFLHSVGYEDWLSIPVHKGKEKSLSFTNLLPRSDEKDMLKTFLAGASKWTVIVGYDEQECKWSDIAHNAPRSRIEAEFIVTRFA